MMKSAAVLALILGSHALLGAQTPAVTTEVVRLTGGVHFSTAEHLKLTADRAEVNQKTGEVLLFGTVVLRQEPRPGTQQVADTNHAGVPFPDPKVTIRVRGNFEVAVGELVVHAEEADINGVTGEMALRGNVRLTNPRWAGK